MNALDAALKNAFDFKIVSDESDRERLHHFHKKIRTKSRARISAIGESLNLSEGMILVIFQGTEIVGSTTIHFSKNSALKKSKLYDFDRFEKLYPGRVAFMTKPIFKPGIRRTGLFFSLMKEIYKVIRKESMEVTVLDGSVEAPGVFKAWGFHHYKSAQNDSKFGLVQPMVMYNRDEAYFEVIDSPLHDLCRSFNALEKLSRSEKNNRAVLKSTAWQFSSKI